MSRERDAVENHQPHVVDGAARASMPPATASTTSADRLSVVISYRRDRFLHKLGGVSYIGRALRDRPPGEGERRVLPDDSVEYRR